MAEFNEVIHHFKRMCKYYQHNNKCWQECPMDGINISQCREIMFNEPKLIEKTIILPWVKDHPELVYPTWVEYFRKIGIIPNGQKLFHDFLMKPIPDEIAQKLGIEPMEDKHSKL